VTTPAGQPLPTAGTVAGGRFPPHSRYAATKVLTDTADDGTERRYLGRRFIPPADAATIVAQHLVVAGDRLDVLAQQYYGDPLLGWRIADANGALDPGDLADKPGDVLRIATPDISVAFGGTG